MKHFASRAFGRPKTGFPSRSAILPTGIRPAERNQRHPSLQFKELDDFGRCAWVYAIARWQLKPTVISSGFGLDRTPITTPWSIEARISVWRRRWTARAWRSRLCPILRIRSFRIVGLDLAIHRHSILSTFLVSRDSRTSAWTTGSSPVMTRKRAGGRRSIKNCESFRGLLLRNFKLLRHFSDLSQ